MRETLARPVTLGADADLEALQRWADRATAAAGPLQAGDAGPALALARDLAADAPHPGDDTCALWEVLATIAAVDLSVVRAIEPHLDAVHILRECPDPVPAPDDATWGVYAAEGPGMKVTATERDGRWRLEGRKPWCSLAGSVSHAIVTAHVDGGRRAFAVALADCTPVDAPWPSRGLAAIPSTALDLADVAGEPVGETDWYLRRPGFWWGGMGVAAIWCGGAVGVARRLVGAAGDREPDQVAQAHIGALDHRLAATTALLRHAAAEVDAGRAAGDPGYRLALQVRRTVAETVEDVLRHVAHGLGPGPLSTDEEHARRVADLQVYVRQDHAERDDAALGRLVLTDPTGPWGG